MLKVNLGLNFNSKSYSNKWPCFQKKHSLFHLQSGPLLPEGPQSVQGMPTEGAALGVSLQQAEFVEAGMWLWLLSLSLVMSAHISAPSG